MRLTAEDMLDALVQSRVLQEDFFSDLQGLGQRSPELLLEVTDRLHCIPLFELFFRDYLRS